MNKKNEQTTAFDITEVLQTQDLLPCGVKLSAVLVIRQTRSIEIPFSVLCLGAVASIFQKLALFKLYLRSANSWQVFAELHEKDKCGNLLSSKAIRKFLVQQCLCNRFHSVRNNNLVSERGL